MSQMAYHWEARFRQRQVDKANSARQRIAEQECAKEAARSEMAAQQAHARQERENARKKALQQQIQTRDKSGMKKSYNEREQSSPTKQKYHYQQGHKTLTVEM